MRGTLVLAVLFALFVGARSWDSMDLQMFDLIEEVKMNFYDYLGIDKVRVRLFLIGYIRLQPVMMSGERIEDCPYNDVLVNGLPDWKTTVYYYRKLRKMSNLELFLLFSILCTVVHYAVLWGVRFEKVLTLEDQLSTVLKRYKARDRKREQIDLQISEELSKVPKPKWHDILPFAICKGTYAFLRLMPTVFSFFKGQISEKIEEHRQLQRELIGELSL
ncbi:hypothetical protein FBUS_06298 [Fasciolopsis buskii]|uniref:Uncharacterized protein n=1 Tax=Fasciolopsis buskii TaxID=27845 RepID=A0A8E0S015_9TREM|nr:hypothetical protein FBUS_06298 [Fasciolopsis buski]